MLGPEGPAMLQRGSVLPGAEDGQHQHITRGVIAGSN